MNRILFLFLITAFAMDLFPQAYSITDLNSLYDHYTFEKSKVGSIGTDRYHNIEGTPYLADQFIEGEVIINDTILVENVPLRYNAFTDKIEFTDDKKQVLEVNTSGNSFLFKFDNRNFVIRDYINKNNKLQGFLEWLVDGKIKLYRKYIINYVQGTKAIGYQDAKPNRFVKQDDVYLLAINNEIPEAFFTKKQLLEKLKKVYPNIEQYLNSYKLKMGSEKSLTGLIEYCNSKL